MKCPRCGKKMTVHHYTHVDGNGKAERVQYYLCKCGKKVEGMRHRVDIERIVQQ